MKKLNSLRKVIALLAALSLLATAGVSAFAQDNGKHFSVVEAAARDQALTIPEIAAKARTSIVAIETETKIVYNDNYYNNPFGSPFGGLFGYGYGFGYGDGGRRSPREYTQKAAGSGVIISDDGYIVTNNHVISGADKITVYVAQADETAEEVSYEATLVGSSESNDIAVLKIDAEGLNPVSFGDSDQLQVGELAVVIGNPMGTVHGSVTVGIISAKEQQLTIDDVTINAIQTDAAVNPGNSGGALFDSFGNMVGVVYAKTSSVQIEGIGYAIPVNHVKTLIEQMINDPDSVQAQTDGSKIMLGITITDVTESISKQYNMPVGVYITDVSSMSAAERAGLQRGDIITSFAGETVKSADDLNAIKAKQTPGKTVEVTVDRNGRSLTLDLVVPQPTDVDTMNNNAPRNR